MEVMSVTTLMSSSADTCRGLWDTTRCPNCTTTSTETAPSRALRVVWFRHDKRHRPEQQEWTCAIRPPCQWSLIAITTFTH